MAKAEAPFIIPSPEIRYFKQLASIEVDTLGKIAAWLNKAKPQVQHRNLAGEASDEIGMDSSEVEDLFSFLARLMSVRRRFSLDTSQFLNDLSAKLNRLTEDSWGQQDRLRWKDREEIISRLLDTRSALGIGAKAAELLFEQPLVLCDSRIISDLRPIFDDDAEVIEGFINFHTLVLRCFEGDKEKVIHVAMDNNDVEQLRKHAERAVSKVNMIDQEFKSRDVDIIELERKKEE
jgi:hypothetical protein